MFKSLYVVSLLILVSACSQTPEHVRPELAIPTTWKDLSQTDPVAIAQDWWKNFNAPELNALMDKALANNSELKAGIYKIEQARASLKKSGADLMPSIDAKIGSSNSRTNPNSGKSYTSNNLSSGIDIAYEVDLFGANKAAVEVSKKNLEISEYDQEALKLVVMGDVASNYFTLVNLKERLDIADKNLSNAEEILKIVKSRRDMGLDSDIEVAEQKASVASIRAGRASIADQIKNTENALSVLLGETPQAIKTEVKSLSAVMLPKISPDMPSRILEQRPDVRTAEANLYIAEANIGIARAALFPSFTLSSGWSVTARSITDPSATALSLVSSLSAPLFKGWSLEAGVEQATASQKELIETYRQTVLESLQEVEDAISAVDTADKREIQLLQAQLNTTKAYDLSKKKYEAGSINYQTLLVAQNSQLSAEDTYLQARLVHFNSMVTLYKALGGGWKKEVK